MLSVLSPVDRPLVQPPLSRRMEDRLTVLLSLLLEEHSCPGIKRPLAGHVLCAVASCVKREGGRRRLLGNWVCLILREPAWGHPTPTGLGTLTRSPQAGRDTAALCVQPEGGSSRSPCAGPVARAPLGAAGAEYGTGRASPSPSPSPTALVAGAVTRRRRKPWSSFNWCDGQWHWIQSTLRPDGAGTARVGVWGSQDTAHTWPGQTDRQTGGG